MELSDDSEMIKRVYGSKVKTYLFVVDQYEGEASIKVHKQTMSEVYQKGGSLTYIISERRVEMIRVLIEEVIIQEQPLMLHNITLSCAKLKIDNKECEKIPILEPMIVTTKKGGLSVDLNDKVS